MEIKEKETEKSEGSKNGFVEDIARKLAERTQ